MDMINNVIKAMNGDQEAISELYYVTYPKLRAVAVSILKNEADAEDIVQDSYIKAFSSLHQLDNAKRFEPWLCRIVSNKCKDYLKKNKPVLFSTKNEDDDSEPIEWSIEDESKEYNPEEVLISSDTRKQIMELLDSLPDEQRICLVCYVVQDMKISEIAELLEVSESTVKSRINYAKSKMQSKINDLEKKGVKLRGFAGFALFPFIRYLFSSESVSIPPISAQITASSAASAAQATATAAETLSVSSTVIGETAKTVAGQAIKHLGIKIASGIVAAAIATTAIIGITHPEWLNSTLKNENESSETTSNGNEIREVTDEYIKGIFYLAQEMYDEYIYGRDVKTYELSYTPSNEYIEYDGCFLEKLGYWDSYEHFILNLENRFSKAAVTEIITRIQLTDYEGNAFCNLREGIGDPISGDYTVEYVQRVSESKYRIHISFLSLAMEQETIDMYCIYENDTWVIDGINFYDLPDTTTTNYNESSQQTTITESLSTHSCSHEKYFKDDGGLHFIGGWYDQKPGIENRIELYAECTEKRHVVCKCPECLEPVLYEELEPLGHDFSGEDIVIIYPSVAKEGSYGKICKRDLCNETSLTTPIPKRSGDYSNIASCFSVSVGMNNQEHYAMSNPDIYISDYRTWGSVPTITYNMQTNQGSIEFIGQDGTKIKHTIIVDMELINQGWGYYGKILETGLYESKYSRLAFNGSAS